MKKSKYRHGKRRGGSFVQLHGWLMRTEAWATMKPGPRALYVELKRRFNGSNNGRIMLSHREAAKLLNVHRNTVGPWFDELQVRGFIRMAEGPSLGIAGVGQTAKWVLEEEPTDDMKPARKTFTSWPKKQNPCPKNRTPRHKKQDTVKAINLKPHHTVIKFGPHLDELRKSAS